MMSEVGAACPPQEADIREVTVHTIVLIRASRVFQCLNNAGNREFIHRIATTLNHALHGGEHRRTTRRVAAVGKMIGEAKPAARCANLPEHGGEGDQHPVFLLAKLLALHPPARHQHGGIFMEKLCQFANFICTDATNFRRPLGGFRCTVLAAGQIPGKNLITSGTAGEKLAVVPALLLQRVGDAEHQRHVGAHVRRNPLPRLGEELSRFRAHGVDTNNPFAALTQLIEPRDPLFIGGIPRNF
ncbi:Uncharacterised protein [Yokenella regensburgei]|nr:Uncharacterised protein [Yokenella regensburgei]